MTPAPATDYRFFPGPATVGKDGQPVERDERKAHWANFVHCVKARKEPISDVHSHMRGLDACHLAGIAARLGRGLKWDAAAGRMVGDDQADAMLSRPCGKGWEIAG
ncbi:MAG: hypothetical protein ACKOZU_00925 [Planctomycetaceae bacterium]